jgi:hypothetical protein
MGVDCETRKSLSYGYGMELIEMDPGSSEQWVVCVSYAVFQFFSYVKAEERMWYRSGRIQSSTAQ